MPVKIKKVETKVPNVIGIAIQMKYLEGITLENAQSQVRDEIRSHAVSVGALSDDKGLMPVEVKLPCGNVKTFKDVDCIPFKDVPCSCGDPTHWFVKYGEESCQFE